MEDRLPGEIVANLNDVGHCVKKVAAYDSYTGHAHAILIDDEGFKHGGVDPRSDGIAIGW